MRKVFAAFCALSFAALPAFSVDFGLTIDNTLGLAIAETATLQERLKASAWFNDSWTDEDSGIFYEFSAIGIYVLTELRPYLFDIEELRFSFRNPRAVGGSAVSSTDLGRFRFVDQTGSIMNHISDGVTSSTDYGFLRTKFMAGYTGLQLVAESRILVSAHDFGLVYDPAEVLGSKRVFVEAGLEIPELFLRQNLSVSAFAQIDTYYLAPRHSMYAALVLDGPITSTLYYELQGVLSFFPLNQVDKQLGALILTDVNLFLPEALNSALNLNVYFSAGSYSPLTFPSLGFIFMPDPVNLLRLNIGYSMKPFAEDELVKNLGFRADLRMFAALDVGVLNGFELELGADWKIFSDLGLGLSAGFFLPTETDKIPEGRVQLFVSTGI